MTQSGFNPQRMLTKLCHVLYAYLALRMFTSVISGFGLIFFLLLSRLHSCNQKGYAGHGSENLMIIHVETAEGWKVPQAIGKM